MRPEVAPGSTRIAVHLVLNNEEGRESTRSGYRQNDLAGNDSEYDLGVDGHATATTATATATMHSTTTSPVSRAPADVAWYGHTGRGQGSHRRGLYGPDKQPNRPHFLVENDFHSRYRGGVIHFHRKGAGTTMKKYDVIVVGGGVAGLSAALLLARARRRVAVADDGHPRNAPAEQSRGFLSRDGESPAGLLRLGRDEVAGYGAVTIDSRVRRIDAQRRVELVDGSRLQAARVLVASGIEDVLPEIPGVREGWGHDVLHCPYCHAHEAGTGPFVVLGTHPGAVHHAILLTQWVDDVVLAVGGLALEDRDRAALRRRGVRTVEGAIERVDYAEGELSGVRIDGALVAAGKVFVFPVPGARDAYLDELSPERNPMGFPATDPTGRTSVPWLYVAGNAADPRGQLLPAAGDGARVAFALNNALVHDEAYTEG